MGEVGKLDCKCGPGAQDRRLGWRKNSGRGGKTLSRSYWQNLGQPGKAGVPEVKWPF